MKPLDQQRREFETVARSMNEQLERGCQFRFEPADDPGWTYDSIRTELAWRIWQEQERRHEAKRIPGEGQP